MASRSRRGGGSRGLNSVLWFLLIAGIIFAFFQIPYDPGAKGLIDIAKSKSETVGEWAKGIAPGIGNWISDIIQGSSSGPEQIGNGGDTPDPGQLGNGGNTPDPATVEESEAKLNSLIVASASGASYNRDDWSHWKNVRSCWSVREEVLSSEAVAGSLVLKDKDGATVTDIASACEIVSGTWNDPYSGTTFTNPSDLDIDHMIPLNYAAQHGADSWDKDKKAAYANNLDYADHLIAVHKGENRSKSDRGPSSWKPSNQSYWCEYSKDWINISKTWELSIAKEDVKAIKEMLTTCP